MNIKRCIKLVNNERINSKIVASKACDTTSKDICTVHGYDFAECTVFSYDKCNKDYAACYNNGYDYCYNYRDTDVCSNEERDIN